MRALLILLVMCGSARAEEDDDHAEAQRQIDAGARLLDDGHPQKARLRYEMAQRLVPGDPRPLLGLALADSQLGQCPQALQEIDAYLAQEKQPDPKALKVLSLCPRATPPPATPPPATTTLPTATPQPATAPPAASKKPRVKRFHLGVELGLNVPVTSASLHVDFLGTLEFGVVIVPKIGLSALLLAESIVSRASVTPGSSKLSTVFTENLLLGVQERYVVWRHLLVFGTLAAGLAFDTFHGFVEAAVAHVDAGVGWEIGPGEIRLRPLDFSFLFNTTDFGAAWRATAGYAFRF